MGYPSRSDAGQRTPEVTDDPFVGQRSAGKSSESNRDGTTKPPASPGLNSAFDRGIFRSTPIADLPTAPEATTELPAQRAHTPPTDIAATGAPVNSSIFSESEQHTTDTHVLARPHYGLSFNPANSPRSSQYWPLSPATELRTISPSIGTAAEAQGSDFTRIPSGFFAQDDVLLNHYFTEVCRLVSAFDSPTNPFRYMISDLIVDSPLILNCVLSISARWEVQRDERFLSKALHYHSAAVGYLSDILVAIGRRDASFERGCTQPLSRLEHDQIKQAILASILLGIASVSFNFFLHSDRQRLSLLSTQSASQAGYFSAVPD